jgi:DHA1 family tetracycline resistance protein-like MFS transporter
LGFIAGPALGGLLGDHDLRLPFLVAAGMTLLNWLYGMFVLPESLALENRREFSWKRANPVGSFRSLMQHPLVFGLAISFFLLNLAQFSTHSTWVLYTGYRYDWSPKQVGASLAVVGLTVAIVQGGLSRKIIPALGEPKALVVGLCINVAAMIGYGTATQGWMVYCILAVASFGAIGGPAAQALITGGAEANEQGAVQGALTSLSSVAGFIAPIVSTYMFGYFISTRAPFRLPGAPFYLAAILILGALVVAIVTLRRHPPIRPGGSPGSVHH